MSVSDAPDGPDPGASAPGVVFHVGLHKTGTTWLQNNVFKPGHGHSIEYSELRRDLRGIFSKPRHDAFSPDAARDRLEPLLSKARETGRVAVLSDEALAGFPFGDRFRQAVTLERIAATFPQAGLIVTIREQVRILHSVYGHYLRGGGTATLQNFLAQPPEEIAATWDPIVDLDYYDYARMLTYCRGLFGADRVVMIPMEAMLADPSGLFERLQDRFGMVIAEHAPPDAGRVVNPAWSDLGYSVNRYLNHMKSGSPRWSMQGWRLKPNGVAARIDRLTPGALRKRQKARQLETVATAVGSRYAASNSALAEMLDLDLAQFGYRTL